MKMVLPGVGEAPLKFLKNGLRVIVLAKSRWTAGDVGIADEEQAGAFTHGRPPRRGGRPCAPVKRLSRVVVAPQVGQVGWAQSQAFMSESMCAIC